MTTGFASRIILCAFVGVSGCTTGTIDGPGESPAEARAEATAWVPGSPLPIHKHADGVDHSLSIDWVLAEDSVEALTDHSQLIVDGKVENTRYDVIRTYAQQGDEQDTAIYTDFPVTIATVRIKETARTTDVKAGGTVDVMFPGGLLTDGCTLEPEDNPLPHVGDESVLFLTPREGAVPLATASLKGMYAVTGGPVGRVVIRDGVVTGGPSPLHEKAIERFIGKPLTGLLSMVSARANAVSYVSPESRIAPIVEHNERELPTTKSWCGLPGFGYKWCRRPTSVTYTNYAGWRWPVGEALNAWMYTGISNSLYLYQRWSGWSDVMVYGNWYGYTGWYGYAWNNQWYGCMTSSTVNLNNTYYTGYHYAKTVALHEVGHTLGFAHYWNCNSIMYTNPTVCRASLTSCDAQAASEVYRY